MKLNTRSKEISILVIVFYFVLIFISSPIFSKAEPVLIPVSFDFGLLSPTKDSCATFTFQTALQAGAITDISFAGHSKDFSMNPPFTKNIALGIGDSYSFTVCYTGDMAQLETLDTLVVTFIGIRFISPISGHTLPRCIETIRSSHYLDPIPIGSTGINDFQLINPSASSITISNVLLDDSVNSGFKITSAFPIIVPAFSSDHTLNYIFSPKSDVGGAYYATTFATIELFGDSIDCKSATMFFIGNISNSTGSGGIDTNENPIFSSQGRTLKIIGDGKPVSKAFTFINNSNVPTVVNNISLSHGTDFHISSLNPSPTPFLLSPDQALTVIIMYSALDKILHTDVLFISTGNNVKTPTFQVQGIQIPSDVAPDALPHGVAITLMPNPVSNFLSVGISGAQTSDVQIFDILGKEIASAKVNSAWKCDASNFNEGAYIIRVSGTSLNGEHFVSSRRIIVSR